MKCDTCEFLSENKKSMSNHLRFGCNKGIPWHIKNYQNRKDYWKNRRKVQYQLKREEICRQRRIKYLLNSEKEKKQTKEYAKTEKGKLVRKAVWHRYRTQKAKGNVTTEQITYLFESQKNCQKCNAIECLEIDHVLPLSKGGEHKIENLQLLCRKCNRSKGNKIWN